MRTEARFLLALALVFGVIWGTNTLFPPVLPEAPVVASEGAGAPGVIAPAPSESEIQGSAGAGIPAQEMGAAGESVEPVEVVVETPLARWVFNARGAQLSSVELKEYRSLRPAGGLVQLVGGGGEVLEKRLVIGGDTVELGGLEFTVSPSNGLQLAEGEGPAEVRFEWRNAEATAEVSFAYRFDPERYVVEVESRVAGLGNPVLVERIARGIPFTEADSAQEIAAMSWVGNHLNRGIDAHALADVEGAELNPGPFTWVGVKNKYFLVAMIPGLDQQPEGSSRYLGAVLEEEGLMGSGPSISATYAYDSDEATQYRLFFGPQEYSRLQSIGDDLEEVNPYGWKFLRPVIRPFVVLTLWVLNLLHDQLSVGYGWVLVIFGVLMRVVLWPLNQKAMRSQMRNMAVQPMLKEVQNKYRDNPERLQKEMLRLHKEYGFNPLGGCLPLLVPWPVLIALFFVFQNTIELRGVAFLWLPDLSAKDPLYLLPLFMAVSMFFLQWISFRSMPDQGNNPQMKAMMYFMPIFFGFIFMQFPSGLNLYYAVTNIATIPQQILIARERKSVAGKPPVRVAKGS